MFFNILGVLFVLLALCLTANASDTSSTNEPKRKAIVVVSVLDHLAFTEADVSSLKRFLNRILPDHEFIHVTRGIPPTWGRQIAPKVKESVRDEIRQQLMERIKPNHEITHLILMDHGNTNLDRSGTATFFRFLSSFGEKNVHKTFEYIFEPLVGRFSDNAFVMLESCLTMCSDLWRSQKRAKTLMDYFKIKSGTLFGSYQTMVSVGHDTRYHLEQAVQNLKNPLFIGIALTIGIAVNFENILQNSFDFSTFLMAAGFSDMAIAAIYKTFTFFHERTNSVNWGYLYKFKNSNLETVYNLEPYRNKHRLYLHAQPENVIGTFGRCGSLFH